MNMFRRSPQPEFNFEELIIDNFAGGGGASTGIEQAVGRPVDIAINHDPEAIRMHETNHPWTKHYCESVWDVDPRIVTNCQPVGLCWLSPDCKHFSKAKGGKPVNKEIRGLAWVAVRWAATVRPRVIILENVEEFKTWGPLDGERPCPKNKGRTFRSFINALNRQGYKAEWRELRACDYGAPTIRKRLFMIARCDGLPIIWPKPTHAAPESDDAKYGRLPPYRTAAECIDWSIPCPSIFDRKKPLAENTLKRIARGLQRFVIDNPEPFVAPVDKLQIAPFITEFANSSNQRNMPGNEPLRTICAQVKGGHFALVTAFLAKHYGGNYTGPGVSLDSPMDTITSVDHHALVTSHLVKLRGTCKDGQPVNQPIPTITAGGLHVGEVRAFLLKYYGNDKDGVDLNEPLHTISSRDRFGLVTVHGAKYQIVDIGMRMLQPHELFRAQGFPDDYIIDRDYTGAPYSKTAQVARCGNSVSPACAKALVEANYAKSLTMENAA
jgi:DNA (cytosine-5)-methyltransferase 1